MEADTTGEPVLTAASNPKDSQPTGIDRSQTVGSVQPLSSLVSPLSPSAADTPSTELQGTSPGPSESSPIVLADAGNRSAVTGIPSTTTFLGGHHNGLREESVKARPDEQSVSDISRKPTPPIITSRSANKLESRVFPDEHCVINDGHLKCTPYIVNVKYRVLICTDCRYCIKPDRALEHLRHEHPHCKVEATFPDHLKNRFPDLVAEAIHPPETVEAVFGLAIPVDKYTVCSRCRRGYVDVSTWQRHACKNAGATLAGQRPHFSCHVQTFFRAPRICYFPVEIPDSVSDGTVGNDFDLFTANFQELAVSDGEIHEPDYRELNQFLQKEGWINHVSGFSPCELSPLTSLSKEGDLRSISRDVIALMSNIQTAIGTAGYHVRRLLGKRPA